MVPCITKSIIMTTYFATILIIILRKQRGEISYIRGKATVHSLTLLYCTETMVIFGSGKDTFIYNGRALILIYEKIRIVKLINEGIMSMLTLCKGIINTRK